MFRVAWGAKALVLVFVWLAVAWVMPDSMLHAPGADPDGYVAFARTWSTHGVFGPSDSLPSAYRSPGYPALLVPLIGNPAGSTWLILGLHLAAGLGTMVLAVALARECGAGTWAPLAGWLVALDPLLARQGSLVMTETVFAALLTGIVLGWMRLARSVPAGGARVSLGSVGLGLLVGAAALVRPIAWPCWLAIGIIAWRQGRFKVWLWGLVVALAVLAPWAVRNQRLFGTPIFTTTHGGYTLWLGQNPDYYREVVAPGRRVWPEDGFRAWTAANEKATAGMDEPARDRFFRDQALSWMRANKLPALHAIAEHIRAFWSPAPNYGPRWARWLCGVFYAAVFALGGLALVQVRSWRPPTVALPLLLLVFTAVHALYWSDARMRTPLVACIAVLASLGAGRLETLSRRKGTA